jgi:hypothetical protein
MALYTHDLDKHGRSDIVECDASQSKLHIPWATVLIFHQYNGTNAQLLRFADEAKALNNLPHSIDAGDEFIQPELNNS